MIDSAKENGMKRLPGFPILIATVICLLTGCSSAQQPRPADARLAKTDSKILIVYLSRTNNTKAVAEFIHEEVGGTLVPLELVTQYPADYRTTVEQVAQENETGFLPPLKTTIDRMEQYDTIFVGFPTWGMQLPPPMKSFLKAYDLQGKRVIPFNTNGGYGEGSTISTLKTLCGGCTVLDGFTTRGGVERDGVLLAIKDARAAEVRTEIINWLRRIKILQ